MIAVPDSKLLRVQRWIHQEILLHQQNHQISTAFAPGCAPMLNAERHCGARWLVKVDISNFFEAISERQVYYVFREIGYPRLLSFQLTRLCTRIAEGSRKYRQKRWHTEGAGYKVFSQPLIGHLPQGAPTSPIISNLVCRRLDELLVAMASEYNCIVTRYADDIVFSGAVLGRDMAIALIEKVSALLGGFGFSRNRRKTQIVPPGARRVVTGLLVDSSKPRLTRKFKDNLRLQLYHAWTKGIHEHCLRRKFRSIIGFREHLHGLITYAELIDPVFGARCREKFVSLPWEQFELLSYD